MITLNGCTYDFDSAAKLWSGSYNPVVDIFRTEVRQGDGNGVDRAELSGWQRPVPKGKTQTAQFALTIEPGAAITAGWVILAQWHPFDAKGGSTYQQALSLEIPQQGDRFRLVARSAPSLAAAAQGGGLYAGLWDSAPFVRGREYAVRTEATFDETKGHVRLWVDGKLVVDRTGPLGYGGMASTYFKAGIYRASAPETLAVQLRGLKDGVK